MSFERNAASPERSLMDIFGPDASNEAKTITERAAQLSMNDMANILNAKKSSQNDLTVGAMVIETYASENSKRIALMHSRPQLNALNRRAKKPFVKS
ncbi:hypothetical protein PEC302107_37370 [Pectobacterium araliae]|uniref:Uncharacterized protein n=1 Tax=Pectobacterium araliae TaxID=3073862 RepID=A0AAN0K9P3_9GAMM|nr:hypothetical protein PEC302110_12970 [Pectobacterium sp. MAFF 302110]GKW22008.1 hypothetical protein PEC302107_37370 [Pectobacterium carotovorum subsp. carotovorum]